MSYNTFHPKSLEVEVDLIGKYLRKKYQFPFILQERLEHQINTNIILQPTLKKTDFHSQTLLI